MRGGEGGRDQEVLDARLPLFERPSDAGGPAPARSAATHWNLMLLDMVNSRELTTGTVVARPYAPIARKPGGIVLIRNGEQGAFERLNSEYGAKPETIIAAVGPAACGKDYEVGQEVIDAFIDESEDNHAYFTRTRPGHALVDLFAANIEKLRAAGLSDANIYAAPFCTMERTDLFFSYRKEKRKNGRTGRLLSVIGRSEQGR